MLKCPKYSLRSKRFRLVSKKRKKKRSETLATQAIKKIYRNFMPGHNTWAFLMYDILPHLSDQGLPVWSVIQEEQTYLSVDRCPLSSRCHRCNNYSFGHLRKSLSLGMRTCWLIHQRLPSSSFSYHHVTPPGNRLWHKGNIIVALKFNKLFTVLWDSSEWCQLSDVDSSVSHIFTVTSAVIQITSRNNSNMGSTFSIVTDDCLANSSPVQNLSKSAL